MKVTDIRSVVYEYDMNRPIGDVHHREGGRRRADIAVFIDTDEGITGEAVAFSWAFTTIPLFAPVVIGADPRSVRGIWDDMMSIAFKPGNSGPLKAAIGAIDCALWDLRAKLNGVPLWKELGASTGRVKGYGSGLDSPLSDEEMVAFYRRQAARGINAGKLKVGPDQTTDLQRLELMRDALATSGKHPILMVDSNEYWAPKQAVRRLSEMEESFDIYWAEEPAPRWDYRGLRTVRESVRAAVATGENLSNPHEYTLLVDNQAADILQIGMATSGITGALRVAELAYAHDLQVSMMNAPGSFMAHAAAVMPHHTMMEIFDAGRSPVFSTGAVFEDGDIVLGDTPGAIHFDLDRLEQHRVSEPSKQSFFRTYRKHPGSGVDEYRSVPSD